jgi:hypothetical protein
MRSSSRKIRRAAAASTISAPVPETPARTTKAGAWSALNQPGRPAWMPKMKPSVEWATMRSGMIVSARTKLVFQWRVWATSSSRKPEAHSR